MFRLILTVLFLVIFLILSIPVFLVELIIGLFSKSAKDHSSLKIVQGAFHCVLFCAGVKSTVIGRENIPEDTPVLYIGNHLGFFDVVLAYTQVKGLTGFISKIEIAKVPLLSTWMRFLHCLFLDRKDIKAGLKMINDAVDLVKDDTSIFIFPEGTRNKEPEHVQPFKEGSFKIAKKANCPIVPVTFNNSAAVLEDHFPWIRKAHVIMEFGKPVYIDQLAPEDQKALAPYVHNIIETTYQQNKSLI